MCHTDQKTLQILINQSSVMLFKFLSQYNIMFGGKISLKREKAL